MNSVLEVGLGGHTTNFQSKSGTQISPHSVKANTIIEGLHDSFSKKRIEARNLKYWRLGYYLAMPFLIYYLMFGVFMLLTQTLTINSHPKIKTINTIINKCLFIFFLSLACSCNKIPNENIHPASSFSMTFGTKILPNSVAFVIDSRTVKENLDNRLKMFSVNYVFECVAHADTGGGNIFIIPVIEYGGVAEPLYFKIPGIPKYQLSKHAFNNEHFENTHSYFQYKKFLSDSLEAERKLALFVDSVKPIIYNFLNHYYYWEPRDEYDIDGTFNYSRILLNTTASKGKIIIAYTKLESVNKETLENLKEDYLILHLNYGDYTPSVNNKHIQKFDFNTISHVLK